MKISGKLSDSYHMARAVSRFGATPGGSTGQACENRLGPSRSVMDSTATNLYSVSIVGDPVSGEILLEHWNLLADSRGKVPGAILGQLRIQPQDVPGIVLGIHRGRSLARDRRYGLGSLQLPYRVADVDQGESQEGDIEVRLGGPEGEPMVLLRKTTNPLGVNESVELDLTVASEVAALLLMALDDFPEDWIGWIEALQPAPATQQVAG